MALKFLNKKGWHTGSLRNIENVWKAEQKHEAEQKKLEELRKQIQEERERSEFRLLQEQAGLVPKQDRLEFLYDSGLAVGKGSSSGGFKALEPHPSLKTDSGTGPSAASSSSTTKQSSVPGALFEEKPQSANDAWRKLHSDPLLLIRQREQEALNHVKNNPIQMAMIRKSVENTKDKKKTHNEDDDKASRRKHHDKKKHEKQSSFKHHTGLKNAASNRERRKSGSGNPLQSSDEELSGGVTERDRISDKYKYKYKYKERRPSVSLDSTTKNNASQQRVKGIQNEETTYSEGHREPGSLNKAKRERNFSESSKFGSSDTARWYEPINRHRSAVKLSEEERAARLREMQKDAELHEVQRWKRLKKAEENDVQEAVRAGISKGSNFLDGVQKRVYGTEKGGSSTIEESVRRRTHYLQGKSEATERNAFRR